MLKNLQLSCWSSPEDVEVTQPLVTIPITKVNRMFLPMSEYGKLSFSMDEIWCLVSD